MKKTNEKCVLIVHEDESIQRALQGKFPEDVSFKTRKTFSQAYEALVGEKVFDVVILPKSFPGKEKSIPGKNMLPLIRQGRSARTKVFICNGVYSILNLWCFHRFFFDNRNHFRIVNLSLYFSVSVSMKVVYPKNIKRGLLAGMTFSIGPLTINVVQMFVLAIGVALALAAFNGFSKSGSKALGVLIAIIVLIIFIIIAFFRVSELGLLPYLAKLVRNGFFDAKKKYQVNYDKNNAVDVMIQESKTKEEKQIIEQKENTFDKQILKDIEKKGLI